MPTSPTDPAGGSTAVRLADGRAWVIQPSVGVGTALSVPGTAVAIHWLALAGDLTTAQAAAAARLMLADASAEPLSDMHVAAGRVENGLTVVVLAPVARMQEWIAEDPDLIVPETLLLPVPKEGLLRRGLDHRGPAVAFSLEPDLAELVSGGAPVEEIDELEFERGALEALAGPAINLRQGAFAKRRRWKLEGRRVRRVALLGATLAFVSLVVQIATILRYSFDADRLEAEAAALGPAAAESRPGFAVLAPLLFEAMRATPNIELTRLDYRPDGSLGATVAVDSPATLAAFRARVEASGLAVDGGNLQSAGGRPTAELVLRPA